MAPPPGAHPDFGPKARRLQGKEKVNTSTFRQSSSSFCCAGSVHGLVHSRCVLGTYRICTDILYAGAEPLQTLWVVGEISWPPVLPTSPSRKHRCAAHLQRRVIPEPSGRHTSSTPGDMPAMKLSQDFSRCTRPSARPPAISPACSQFCLPSPNSRLPDPLGVTSSPGTRAGCPRPWTPGTAVHGSPASPPPQQSLLHQTWLGRCGCRSHAGRPTWPLPENLPFVWRCICNCP